MVLLLCEDLDFPVGALVVGRGSTDVPCLVENALSLDQVKHLDLNGRLPDQNALRRPSTTRVAGPKCKIASRSTLYYKIEWCYGLRLLRSSWRIPEQLREIILPAVVVGEIGKLGRGVRLEGNADRQILCWHVRAGGGSPVPGSRYGLGKSLF